MRKGRGRMIRLRAERFRKDQQGFTLPELMTTIVILGILVAVGVIVFLALLERWRGKHRYRPTRLGPPARPCERDKPTHRLAGGTSSGAGRTRLGRRLSASKATRSLPRFRAKGGTTSPSNLSGQRQNSQHSGSPRYRDKNRLGCSSLGSWNDPHLGVQRRRYHAILPGGQRLYLRHRRRQP